MNRLLIGTRGSALALAQTNEIVEALKRIAPGIHCDIVQIRTKGDKMHEQGTTAQEGKSMYTEEIEDALTAEKIDIAVHSMKDLTTDLPKGLVIAAVPERLNPRDVLISKNKTKLDQLPGEARLARAVRGARPSSQPVEATLRLWTCMETLTLGSRSSKRASAMRLCWPLRDSSV